MSMQEETELEVTEEGAQASTVFKIPVVKGKTFLEVDTGKTPDHVYREALILGFKQLLNRGQTKLTKEAYPDAEQLKAQALAKAEETLENMYQGKIRVAGGKASDKVPREVMTEARRIARCPRLRRDHTGRRHSPRVGGEGRGQDGHRCVRRYRRSLQQCRRALRGA